MGKTFFGFTRFDTMQYNTFYAVKQVLIDCIKMSKYEKNRAHNPKVGGSIPPFATN